MLVIARSADEPVIAGIAAQPVIAGAAGQSVGAASAKQIIIAGTAGQRVVAKTAAQRAARIGGKQDVGKLGADNLFDFSQRVALRVAIKARLCLQVNSNRRAGQLICRYVIARSADKGIGSDPADQRIIAVATFDPVVGIGTDKRVCKVRADQVFDIAQQVARSVAANTNGRTVKIGGNPRVGT
ncbi:MAG: hypothetical protein HC779_04145 [Phyllobacteriaceae bacterium]|nr:hypothetical protein [Phyllobacteriaceae bacterium]